jgi:pyridoxine 4-dehydrogenase
MTTPARSRRDFLLHGGALLAGSAMAARAMAAESAQGGAAKPPAAAAGVLRLGGDLEVNRLGFGAMRITGQGGQGSWGEPANPQEIRALLRRAVALGCTLIDTADAYGPEVSERLIGEALYPYPPGVVIATKGGMVRPNGAWEADGRPEHLRAACEGSLKRLKLERIDLYQLHTPDPKVPYADSVGALARLQQQGKIRHIGVSNVSVRELTQARAIVKVVSVQNRYNVADRDSDDVLAVCEREQLAFLPWSPLAQPEQRRNDDPRLTALEQIAAKRQISSTQASLAWLLARSPVIVPIPGTARLEHLEENAAAAQVKLTPQEMRQVG